MFTTASSAELTGNLESFNIVARDKEFGCPGGDTLRITAAGLPSNVTMNVSIPGPGEIVATLRTTIVPSGFSVYNITYTVTDSLNNTTSVTLPLILNSMHFNSAPTFDPISDLTLTIGQVMWVPVVLSDRDNNLALSQETLTINGLPGSTAKYFTKLTSGQVVCWLKFAPQLYDVGTYRVHIQGRDTMGGITLSQVRVTVLGTPPPTITTTAQ